MLPRRLVVSGGLGGLAALMLQPVEGCSSSDGSDGSGGSGGGAAGWDEPPERASLVSLIGEIGPLGEPDENGVRVPAGFTARIVARSKERVLAESEYIWHQAPDGGATFATPDGGWIYVSNSELPLVGGVGALRFDARGEVVDAYAILTDTNVNCAGGPTPWGAWLSCEEVSSGRVFECDPRGLLPAVVRPLLGIFKHEAAAVDPVKHHVYLTEDEEDGCFYRFASTGDGPFGFVDLSRGTLAVAEVGADGKVVWHDLPDPQFEGSTPTREQVPRATRFDGGEGIWFHAGLVMFSTKGDGRVRVYDTDAETMEVLYDAATAEDPILTGVDNLTVSCCGDVLVAEDGGDMQVVAIGVAGQLIPLVQVVGHDESEITGPAFDPSGTRLYFSSQRGAGEGSGGVTYEITGPFHAPA